MGQLRWIFFSTAMLAPSVGAAQIRVEIGPVLGYFRPYGSFEPASVYSTALPSAPEALKGRALGGEARAWFGGRAGAEVRGSFARSTIPSVSTPVGPSRPTPATVSTVTAQALLTLTRTPARYRIWVSGGIGIARHGGEAYEPYTSLTDIGPGIGVGARLGLTRRLQVTGGLSALTYLFDMPMSPELRFNPGSLERGRQLDVLFHIGVSWVVIGS